MFTVFATKNKMKQFNKFIEEAKQFLSVDVELTEEELREQYLLGNIFNEGSFVEKIETGEVGKIIRRGTNHLICVSEEDKVFRSWITDVKEVTEEVYEIGTCKYRKHAQETVPGQPVKKFSGKIKIKSSYK